MSRNDSTEKPTSWMEDAFANGGSIAIDCACGRTHFADDERAGDFERGELERYRNNAEQLPNDFIGHHGDNFIRHATISGQVLVIGCPCNGLRKYEDFLWENRRGIAAYLMAKSDDLKRATALDDALLSGLHKVAFAP